MTGSKSDTAPTDTAWIERWMEGVKSGKATMSQRSRASIDAHGGLPAVIAAARARGVHLVQLTDDKGKLLVAASLWGFETLC